MENYSEKINLICPVCESGKVLFYVEKNSCPLYRCERCELIFAGKANDESIYSRDYFEGAKNGFGYVDYEADKKPMAAAFESYLDRIEKFLPRKGSLLDVGSATGFFLKIAADKGWDVLGVEISEYAALQARKKGLETITGTLESVGVEKKFDAITFWDVFEHLKNPNLALSKTNKLLKEGGLVAINTPDSGSFAAGILGKRWHLLAPPEHLTIFNQKNLSDLLIKSGFKLVMIAKIGKKYTLQYVFRILANWQKSEKLARCSEYLNSAFFNRLPLPINFRDNFFIIARKV